MRAAEPLSNLHTDLGCRALGSDLDRSTKSRGNILGPKHHRRRSFHHANSATETADVHFGMTDALTSHRKGQIRAADLDD